MGFGMITWKYHSLSSITRTILTSLILFEIPKLPLPLYTGIKAREATSAHKSPITVVCAHVLNDQPLKGTPLTHHIERFTRGNLVPVKNKYP